MSVTAKVQAAKKAAQLSRLEAKEKGSKVDKDGNSKYAGSSVEDKDGNVTITDLGYYANQPKQKVRAAENQKVADANLALTDALENLEVAEITGEGIDGATEAASLASMVVQNLELAKSVARSGGVSLTNAGVK